MFRWQQSGELESYSDVDWGGDKATRRSVSAGIIMRGGHCLKVSAKKQLVVSLSTAESQLKAAGKTASEGLGIQSVAKDLDILCGLKPASGCLSNEVPSQNLWIHEESKSGKFVMKKVGTNVNPANLMTRPLPRSTLSSLWI